MDAHPELAIPPETHFAPGLIERAHEGAGADALVDEIVGARAWADFGIQAERLRKRVTALDEGGAATVLRAFYELCAEREAKRRWGDKTPAYVRSMRPIGRELPEARFVHLIRDGRDVALSRRARGMGAGKPIADTADRWRRRIEEARTQARTPSRPVPRAALRGPGHRAGDSAARLRADRARLRPGDAHLPRAGR